MRLSTNEETTAVTRAITKVDHNTTAIVTIDPERLFRLQRAREPTMVLPETIDRRSKANLHDTAPARYHQPRTAALIGFLGMVWLSTIFAAIASVWIWDYFFKR